MKAARQPRVCSLCLGLTLLACCFAQLFAAASKACAHFVERGRASALYGTSVLADRSARSRCRWALLQLRSNREQLRISDALRVDALGAPVELQQFQPELQQVETEARPAVAVYAGPAIQVEEPVTPSVTRGPVRFAPRRHDAGATSTELLRRRSIVANSFMAVGGSALSAGLIAAGFAYHSDRAYGQRSPYDRSDLANADLQRSQRSANVATSLLSAGGAVFLSGLALKLWSRPRQGADTGMEGKLVAKPHKSGVTVALRGTWGVAL